MMDVLIIDDSPEMCELIASSFRQLPVRVSTAQSIGEAKNLISLNEYAMFVVDLNFPDGDGYSLINLIRNLSNHKLTPIVIVSGSTDIPAKLSAFSIGADDFITKPFHPLEFKARMESKIKKIIASAIGDEVLRLCCLQLHMAKQSVEVSETKETIPLSPREFRLLAFLAKHVDNIYSRQQILDHIWGNEVYVNDRTVDTHIYFIRKKLGQYAKFIESVPGEGYRATCNPSARKVGHYDAVKNI